MRQEPCCARKVTQLTRAKADLRAAARRANSQPHRLNYWAEKIKQAREAVARCEEAIIDHEAEHVE